MTNNELFTQITIGNLITRMVIEDGIRPFDTLLMVTRVRRLREYPNTTKGESLFTIQHFEAEWNKVIIEVTFKVSDNGHAFCIEIQREADESDEESEDESLYNQLEDEDFLPIKSLTEMNRLLYPKLYEARTLDQLVTYLKTGKVE